MLVMLTPSNTMTDYWMSLSGGETTILCHMAESMVNVVMP